MKEKGVLFFFFLLWSPLLLVFSPIVDEFGLD
jgi:hypothetical protein